MRSLAAKIRLGVAVLGSMASCQLAEGVSLVVSHHATGPTAAPSSTASTAPLVPAEWMRHEAEAMARRAAALDAMVKQRE